MSKPIAVSGCTLTLSSGTGSVSIDTSASTVTKFDNKGAYKGTLSISISGYTGGSIAGSSGSGSGTIEGSAQYVMIEGDPAVLQDDESDSITVSGTNAKGDPATASVTVKVSDAGQTVAEGE